MIPPTVATILGPRLSWIFPARMTVTANTAMATANIPRIGKEAAGYPRDSDNGLVNIENAYREPSASCIISAPATTIHLFITFFCSTILSLQAWMNFELTDSGSQEPDCPGRDVVHRTHEGQC